jgi:hypothetical protein
MDCTGCEGRRRALCYIMHHSSCVTHSDYGLFQTSWWRGCKYLPIGMREGKGSAAQMLA